MSIIEYERNARRALEKRRRIFSEPSTQILFGSHSLYPHKEWYRKKEPTFKEENNEKTS